MRPIDNRGAPPFFSGSLSLAEFRNQFFRFDTPAIGFYISRELFRDGILLASSTRKTAAGRELGPMWVAVPVQDYVNRSASGKAHGVWLCIREHP